jgi:membrane-associated phospholipid phosphatase
LQLRKLLVLPLVAGLLAAYSPAWSQTPATVPPPVQFQPGYSGNESSVEPTRRTGIVADTEAYFTAPLHWNGTDWAWFGGALLAIAASHRYDSQVRSHFVDDKNPATIDSHDTQDIIPTAAVFLGTWGFAALMGSGDGKSETWAMFKAAALGGVTAYALKYAIGRDGPDQTSNPNQWFKGSAGSFPSFHSTAAFAVGTVFAESGNDDWRWLRYFVGYGLGVGTSYERLKHNAHWLSDTMAGAALGIASAHFAMNHTYTNVDSPHVSIVPIERGVMVAYTVRLD